MILRFLGFSGRGLSLGCLQNQDQIGSDRIDKTWIELRPINETRTGSEKNRIAINFRKNSHVTSHDQVLV